MVKLAYLRATLFTAAINILLAAHAIAAAGDPPVASPANSNFGADTKAGQNSTMHSFALSDSSQAAVNTFSGTSLTETMSLSRGVCRCLAGSTTEFTWRQDTNAKAGLPDLANGDIDKAAIVLIYKGTSDFCDCTGDSLWLVERHLLYSTQVPYWCIKLS
ncbi:hypothetical protein N7540_000276 [Penicillium herquei]|nr:hypothetical protein N7540_000276 [Penicillium herquei]